MKNYQQEDKQGGNSEHTLMTWPRVNLCNC